MYMEGSVIHSGRNWFIHRCTDAKQSSHRSGSPSLHLGLGPSSAQNFNDCLATMKITQRQVQLSSTKLQRLQSIHSRARSDVLAPSFEYVVSLCPSYECVCSCDRGLGQSGRELLIERKPPPVPVRTEAFVIVWAFTLAIMARISSTRTTLSSCPSTTLDACDSGISAHSQILMDVPSLTDPGFILGNAPRQIEVSETHRSPWVLLVLQELTRDEI
jgi:hypothetical protein